MKQKQNEKLKNTTFLLGYREQNKKPLKSTKLNKFSQRAFTGERKEIERNYFSLMGTSTHTDVNNEETDQDRPVSKYSMVLSSV